MKTATVVDYGAGNLRSVLCSLVRLGATPALAERPDDLRGAERIILPGVGSFGAAMGALEASGLCDAVRDAASRGVPILGICLGMHLLMCRGTEGGHRRGLCLLEGSVPPLPAGYGLTVPHTGWNGISITRRVPLLEGIRDGSCFYFVHSFAVDPGDPGVVCALTGHGAEFPSVISSGCISGVQFHPEKSQAAGARMLLNFLGDRGVR